jgi:hypothetical protein
VVLNSRKANSPQTPVFIPRGVMNRGGLNSTGGEKNHSPAFPKKGLLGALETQTYGVSDFKKGGRE